MSDLIASLRRRAKEAAESIDAHQYGNVSASPSTFARVKEMMELFTEAADEIERLRADIVLRTRWIVLPKGQRGARIKKSERNG